MLYGYLNSPFVSNPFSDAAIPPTSLTSPVISGSGVVGQTLSTTNGTWSGTLPITYSYQWNRNGSVILGATFNTYTLVTADASTSITCTVTATNAGGFASSTSNAISVAAAGDADANAFIAAAAITDTTQKSAIEKLVVDLKGYGIWTKMKAIYPFVGGVASSHKFNLRNPLDTDAAFRLIFYGGVTHNLNGITGNSTNAYADTLFKDSVSSTPLNKHISMYQRNLPPSNSGSSMGAFYQHRFYLNISGTNYSTFEMPQSGFAVQSPQNGFFAMSKIASVTAKYYQNSLTPLSRTGGADLPSTLNYGLLASFSGVNSAVDYSSANLSFASIGDGLSDSQYTNLNTAVQTFQTTLGRQVGVPIVADADAQAFLNAAVITDQTQANAVNTLVTDLKGYGIWTKMKALYPFVGGTSSQHKYNLKDPRDLDAAYRLTFSGGWVHSNTGALPNGTNSFADTFLVPSLAQTANSNSMGVYSGNVSNATERVLMGTYSVTMSILFNTSTFLGTRLNYNIVSSAISGDSGLLMASRTDATTTKLYKNSTTLATGNSGGTILSDYKILLATMSFGNNNPYGQWSINQFRLAFIADGFSPTEQANLYTAVQTFQTTLSRNV